MKAYKEEISVAEAAKLLRCSTDTAYRLIESGELRAYRLGARGHWRVLRSSVNEILLRANDVLLAK